MKNLLTLSSSYLTYIPALVGLVLVMSKLVSMLLELILNHSLSTGENSYRLMLLNT